MKQTWVSIAQDLGLKFGGMLRVELKFQAGNAPHTGAEVKSRAAIDTEYTLRATYIHT